MHEVPVPDTNRGSQISHPKTTKGLPGNLLKLLGIWTQSQPRDGNKVIRPRVLTAGKANLRRRLKQTPDPDLKLNVAPLLEETDSARFISAFDSLT